MEHRALPHHSPALCRYLNEPACLYGRLQAANGSDRDQHYVDSHKPQLRTVQEDVSRREPSQASHFPFLCVFHFAGCDQKFSNKRDWKDHVVSQHLTLDRVFWECNQGRCKHTKRTRQSKTLLSEDHDGTLFANKHDFRTHLIRWHRPTEPRDKKKDGDKVLDKEVQWLLGRQDSSMRMTCGLPQDLGCPMPQCASVRFTGPTAWDQRLNHAAEHFLTSPQRIDVFGGEQDAELVQWAASGEVGIHKITLNSRLEQHNCGKSVADSGYSSMPGMPRHQNMSQHGDSSPVVPSEIPECSDATFFDHSTEALYMGAGSASIGGWARLPKYLEPIFDHETSPSASQSFQQPFSQYEPAEDEGTAGTSQGSSIADRMPPVNAATAAARNWFHGWLREWLSPLIRERPSGNSNCQSTNSASTSQTRDSSSSSSPNTDKQTQTTNQPRRVSKRKRDNGDDGDDNEKRPKSRRVRNTSVVPRLACPYFKRNPHKYGQPSWKACAHPGFESIHRMKEHLYRNHSPPKYQCRRCSSDLKTAGALGTHSKQIPACDPCTSTQDQDILDDDTLERLRSKKGMGQKKSESEKWTEVYKIVFPNDRVPSPYFEDTEQDKNTRGFNLCQGFGRYLEAELPPQMEKDLTTVEWPLPEPIQQDIVQRAKRLVPQLLGSYLKEMGYVTSDESEQLENASAATGNNADDLSTALQQDSSSEYPTTTLPKGSTSEEAMSMFPTDDGSEELTTMPQVEYDTADSAMFQYGDFSGQGTMVPTSQMMPPFFAPPSQDWQVIYSQFGYDPNLDSGFGGMSTS
ncbi:uncharacterized protein FFB20_11743 [Fusarium fujikuroi]|uniref:C2H2-type domain-containing protein n=2 Tax=Fusarium fujikuroi TaxID=5127 RepID=S0E5Z9_GIBF5|nr:uncharacterized protein FFUJ_14368 [Fusarium fujikuroi IMI 58289]QGI65177.1 hypothetical protein CEK27_009148 [Fusarium fujikuroi]QGI82429.1 hypothetical protein CEK25_009158 [Fusarium fujikuroi]QGI96059.1 hypothetical protein CEK26_009128 [Fusarium fujikuroi]CCT69142.1 uncharacterized protein FFUJ_14368 [Fusarium fujikuroi IMI 58289]SCO02871.1 uncharacterized protein FFB20_11743 [Fusarium fujikuroi]